MASGGQFDVAPDSHKPARADTNRQAEALSGLVAYRPSCPRARRAGRPTIDWKSIIDLPATNSDKAIEKLRSYAIRSKQLFTWRCEARKGHYPRYSGAGFHRGWCARVSDAGIRRQRLAIAVQQIGDFAEHGR